MLRKLAYSNLCFRPEANMSMTLDLHLKGSVKSSSYVRFDDSSNDLLVMVGMRWSGV